MPEIPQVGSPVKEIGSLSSLLHKRSFVSSVKVGLDDASTIKLTKRMEGGGPSYNGQADHLVTINEVRLGRHIEPPRADEAMTADAQERRFAGMVHYGGVPVFPVNAIWKSDLNHALQYHDHVWFRPQDPTGMPFKYDKGGAFGGQDWIPVSAHLRAADQARATFGEKIMLLKYGRPFPRRASSRLGLFDYKLPDWRKKVAKGRSWPVATTDLYYLRQQLNEQGHIRIRDEGTGKTWGLRLLKDGSVDEIKDITDLVRGIRRRGLTVSQPEQMPDWTRIEEHAELVPLDDPALRMPTMERGRYFAEDLHYKGEPIFFPGEASAADTSAKVQRARNNYPGYWIVGHPHNHPVNLKAIHIADGHVSETSEEKALLRNLGEMNQDMYGHKDRPPLNKYGELKYGPDFPKRPSASIHRLSGPGAEMDLPRLPSSASMAEKWEALYKNSILAIDEEGSRVVYALDQAGEVSRL